MRIPPAKVFCVGFNKTGTSSLAGILVDMGYRTYHRADWTAVTEMRDPILRRHDAFTDGELAPVEELSQAFPHEPIRAQYP